METTSVEIPERKKMIRRSKDEWNGILSDYEKSHLTQKEYCAIHDLSPATFYSWYKKRRDGGDFINLEHDLGSDQSSLDWDIELSLGDNVVLRFKQR